MSPYRFWTRKYTAPSLPGSLVLFLVIVSAFLALIGGVSYVSGTGDPGVSRVFLKATVGGPELWGSLLIVGAMTLLGSLVFQLHSAVWASHGILCAVYTSLMLTTLKAVEYFSGGAQELIIPLFGVVWHGMFVFLLRPFSEREVE